MCHHSNGSTLVLLHHGQSFTPTINKAFKTDIILLLKPMQLPSITILSNATASITHKGYRFVLQMPTNKGDTYGSYKHLWPIKVAWSIHDLLDVMLRENIMAGTDSSRGRLNAKKVLSTYSSWIPAIAGG